MGETIRIPMRSKKPIRSEEELIAAAKAKDAKMDRSRKTPTKEEKERNLLLKMLEYKEHSNIIEEESVEKVEKNDNEWDVKIGDRITYFDPNLSYELTGYRPITKDRGLDFDPLPFTESARYYKKYGRYTNLIEGTFLHLKHWEEEFKRCQEGYLIGKYRLTGENYFWLNYFRIPSVLDKSGLELQEESFPTFLAKLYEYFHYLELCRKLGMDGVAFKSRGVGASLIAASNCACAYTFHKGSRNIVTAFADNYVDDTLSKVWQELDFLNTCTQGGFRRVRMKIDTNRKKKASKVDADKNESGWGAIIEGVTADEPRKLRGARTYSLFFEEGGSNPKLIPTYIQSRALVVINGFRVGNRFVFGTAGDTGPNLAGLKDMFYNPDEYFMLPYKHNHTKNGEYVYTGYFIPSYTMWFGTPENLGFDSRGVVDEDRAREYYENEWKKIKDPKKLILDRAEYCFTPEDAFILEGSNNFDQEKLVDQKAAIEIHRTIPLPQGLKLHWQLTDGIPDNTKRPKAEVCGLNETDLHFTELPMCDENGIPFKNLYVIGIDGIDADKDTSSGLTDVSKFCIVVFRRLMGLQPPKPVAIYKKRPKHIKEAWEMALKLAIFYNSKVLVEATRTSVIQYFIQLKKESMLMHRPKMTANSSGKTNFKLYGVPTPEHVILHYLDLIEGYISEYCELIQFLDMLDEFIEYSYENKRKFDIVAAFGMALLANEELLGRAARPDGFNKKKLTFGYSRNEFGLSQMGILKETNIRYEFTRREGFRTY